MANELTIAGGDNKIALPDHLARRLKPEDHNILSGDRTPNLGYRGKVFSMTIDGETTPITRKDEDGNEYPAPSLAVVVVDYAAKMGRSYYEGKYDPNNVQPPVCWSSDSVTPDVDVPEETKTNVTSHKCAGCPFSVKGSAITDSGGTATACAQHRILAVVPIKRLDLAPLRLRIAQTSNYDGRSPELKQKGLFAFQNFLDSLKTRGIPSTDTIVTRLSFDPGPAYPKLLFQAVRFLDDAEYDQIEAIKASGQIEGILGVYGARAAKQGKALPAPQTQAALPAPKPAAQPAEAPAKATVEAAAAPEAEEEDEEAALQAQLAAARARKAAAVTAATTADLRTSAETTTPVKPEAPKRTRRTKEQIAADEAKAAGVAKVGDEKFLPNALDGSSMGDDDEGSEFVPPVAAAKAAAPAKPKANEAVAAPAAIGALLESWDDE